MNGNSNNIKRVSAYRTIQIEKGRGVLTIQVLLEKTTPSNGRKKKSKTNRAYRLVVIDGEEKIFSQQWMNEEKFPLDNMVHTLTASQTHPIPQYLEEIRTELKKISKEIRRKERGK